MDRLEIEAVGAFQQVDSLEYMQLNDPVAVNDADLPGSNTDTGEAYYAQKTTATAKENGAACNMSQQLENHIVVIGAKHVWELGYFVKGTTVGILDSGTEFTHAALSHNYRGLRADGSVRHDYNWFGPYNDSGTEPNDPQGHGTHGEG